jgi:inorganic phosphate transporter, PiT family
VVCALAFNVVAGFNDGGNLLAAAASSRTIAPGVAYFLIVGFAFLGPFVFGTAVATTLGAGIADYTTLGAPLLLAAVVAAVVAVLVAYAARVPTMMSLALLCAMVGSLLVGPGASVIHWPGVIKVALSTSGSALVGLLAGMAAYALLRFLLRPVSRATGDRLMHLQYGTVALQAMGYGANDAEKMMGLMAAAGALQAGSHVFAVPLWVIAGAVAAFACGMAVGGLRIAKTVGGKLFTIRPQHALAFQAAAGSTVIAAALLGAPLSTTETTASAIVGVGAVAQPRRVHWDVVAQIARAWLLTVPVALAAGAVAGLIVRWI